MKISKIYSNQSNIFTPIKFNDGLNVILAEIRLPENKAKDTHNLGKTTLGTLLDFCFLSKKNSNSFLFKNKEKFQTFTFYLEIELKPEKFLTIKRSVANPTRISFKNHTTGDQNLNNLPSNEWDQSELPFEKSKELLDGILNWDFLENSSYRKLMGYLIRSQNDYGNVFHLDKFVGPHSNWKPFLASILGFNGKILQEQYFLESAISEEENREVTLRAELGIDLEDIQKTEGIAALKTQEIKNKEIQLDEFNFLPKDELNTSSLVNDIDAEISQLNREQYSLKYSLKRIRDSLQEHETKFDINQIKKLFTEASILFPEQLEKDYNQLLSFNREITRERSEYLTQDLKETEERLSANSARLSSLNIKRKNLLSQISDSSVFDKYKDLSEELITLKTDLESLRRRQDASRRMKEIRSEIRLKDKKLTDLQEEVDKEIHSINEDEGSLFSNIRSYFNEIIEKVTGNKALLNVYLNNESHLEFKAEILDETGNATSADLGYTYRKLLCVAFDLALLRAHREDSFPQFVYHDGIFESLDPRKKTNLREVLREYSKLGIQTIITTIDSDLPKIPGEKLFFEEEEIALILHDEDASGRLFHMPSW